MSTCSDGNGTGAAITVLKTLSLSHTHTSTRFTVDLAVRRWRRFISDPHVWPTMSRLPPRRPKSRIPRPSTQGIYSGPGPRNSIIINCRIVPARRVGGTRRVGLPITRRLCYPFSRTHSRAVGICHCFRFVYLQKYFFYLTQIGANPRLNIYFHYYII